jgi:hypothetical protein
MQSLKEQEAHLNLYRTPDYSYASLSKRAKKEKNDKEWSTKHYTEG